MIFGQLVEARPAVVLLWLTVLNLFPAGFLPPAWAGAVAGHTASGPGSGFAVSAVGIDRPPPVRDESDPGVPSSAPSPSPGEGCRFPSPLPSPSPGVDYRPWRVLRYDGLRYSADDQYSFGVWSDSTDIYATCNQNIFHYDRRTFHEQTTIEYEMGGGFLGFWGINATDDYVIASAYPLGKVVIFDRANWKVMTSIGGLRYPAHIGLNSYYFAVGAQPAKVYGLGDFRLVKELSRNHKQQKLQMNEYYLTVLNDTASRTEVFDGSSFSLLTAIPFPPSATGAKAIGISPDGRWIAAGWSGHTRISVYNQADFTLHTEFSWGESRPPNAVVFNRNGRCAIIQSTGEDDVKIYDTGDWSLVTGTRGYSFNNPYPPQAIFDDENCLMVPLSKGRVLLYASGDFPLPARQAICKTKDRFVDLFWRTGGDNHTIRWGEDFSESTDIVSPGFNHTYSFPVSETGEKYYYRICTEGVLVEDSFLAPLDSAFNHFTMGLLADTHLGSRHSQRAAELLFAREPSLFTVLGDIGLDGYDYEIFFSTMYPYGRSVPLVPVTGNHDTDGVFWNENFHPEFHNVYYSFNVGNVLFAVTDWWRGYAPGEAQWNWLSETLHGSDAHWKVVLGHDQVFSALFPDLRGPLSGVAPLFVDAGVDLYLAGHRHICEHLNVDGVDYMNIPNAHDVVPPAWLQNQRYFGEEARFFSYTGAFGIFAAQSDTLAISIYGHKNEPIYGPLVLESPTPKPGATPPPPGQRSARDSLALSLPRQ